MILIPPGWFLRELEVFDPLLRLRWSARVNMWQLERKVEKAEAPGCIRKNTEHDDFIRARDRYVLVASIPKDGLVPSVFDRLRESDLWSLGGWEAFARKLEDAELEAEEKEWKDFQDDIRSESAAAYERWKMADGETVFVHRD